MEQEVSREITGLLRAWGAGDADALERLIPRIYNDLRRAARRCMRNERGQHARKHGSRSRSVLAAGRCPQG